MAPKGEKCHLSKLTNNEVALIRKLNKSKIIRKKDIAHKFNISERNLRNIIYYKTWK